MKNNIWCLQLESESHDPVQQFCEKHLTKVKNYIDSIKGKLPIPIKATLDGKYNLVMPAKTITHIIFKHYNATALY